MPSEYEQIGLEQIELAIDQLRQAVEANPELIEIEREGASVLLRLHIESYVIDDEKNLGKSSLHEVQIDFPQNYPSSSPFVRVKPPVLFHPNVRQTGLVELKGWHKGMQMDDLLIHLWKFFAFA